MLSPSTRGTDAGGKLYGYFQLASVEHYLILHPTKRVIIHHHRSGGGVGTALRHDGTLLLDPPGIELDVTACFATVS